MQRKTKILKQVSSEDEEVESLDLSKDYEKGFMEEEQVGIVTDINS